MFKGLLVVNAFLRSAKFEEIYHELLFSAEKEGMKLTVATNAELTCKADNGDFSDFDFVLFWDKDVQLATQLEQRGLPVFNNAQSILRCDDKGLTYLTLKEHHLPMPRTLLAPKTYPAVGYPDTDFVEEAAQTLGFPIVLKECFGSFGQQVYLFHDLASLREKVMSLAGVPLLFQQLIQESFGTDIRINVVGRKVAASLLRHSIDGDFRSNLTRGGTMENYTPTAAEADLAIQAVQALGLHFAGVDVLFGRNGPILCEVNSNAHFKTTLACTGVNMATEILRHIKEVLEESHG